MNYNFFNYDFLLKKKGIWTIVLLLLLFLYG